MNIVLKEVIGKTNNINKKIDKHKMIKRINIKRIEAEIFDEIKAVEEIETKSKKLETKIMRKKFWNEIDEQETLKKQIMKIETEKIN